MGRDTTQPRWKYVANFGDATPLDHGGKFLYVDENKEYEAELEILEPNTEDEDATVYRVFRVELERCKQIVLDTGEIALIPHRYEKDWPHPIKNYIEWFGSPDKLRSVQSSNDGFTPDQLCSEDPRERAMGYIALMGHWGEDEFDQYPLELSRAECKTRYCGGELGRT